MQARKRFGQHFLHDRGVIDRIVAALAPDPADAVVEIGPGRGALTAPLLDILNALHVIEIDRDLAPVLSSELAAHRSERLVIHQADALRFDYQGLAGSLGTPLRVVGNLPYNISTPLLFALLAAAESIRDMLFMLQREVVDRLGAEPGTSHYGRLSVMVQQRARVERILRVGPGAFRPPPKVDSAVVRLTPLPREQRPAPVDDPDTFERVVRSAFNQRRKTLRNALKGLATAETIAASKLDPGQRPETVSIVGFARLANALSASTTRH